MGFMFAPDDAQRIFEQLANVAAAKAGRDFIYTVTRVDGTKVTGHVVTRDGGQLDMLVEDANGNTAVAVAWDAIETIAIASE